MRALFLLAVVATLSACASPQPKPEMEERIVPLTLEQELEMRE